MYTINSFKDKDVQNKLVKGLKMYTINSLQDKDLHNELING